MNTNGKEEEEEGDHHWEGSDDITPDDGSVAARHLPERGGLCMREQDADWLESMHVHGGPNKTGMTPVWTSQCVEDATAAPLWLWSDDVVRSEGGGTAATGAIQERTEPAVLSSSSPLPLDEMAVPLAIVKPKKLDLVHDEPRCDALLPESSSSLSSPSKASASGRRVLSGTIYETEESHWSPNHPSPRTAVAAEAMWDAPATVPPPEEDTLAHRRTETSPSDATERRKRTEAAQFAEAVGVSDGHLLLQIIEEDDDCDQAHGADDDDDATEIIHIQQRNPVGGLLPLQWRGSVTTDRSHRDPFRGGGGIPPRVPATPIPVRTTVPPRPEQRATVSSPRASGFLAQLPNSVASQCPSHDFVYKGIGANPPDIVKRGTTRGNYAQLHRKAWLEVTDKYHRYGKNLRLYYRYWESEGHPTNIFFDWLDSKGDAAGHELPELPDCPRRQLDSDTVLYITNPAVTQGYAVQVVGEDDGRGRAGDAWRRGRLYDVDGSPVITGPDGWIFVLRDNVLYGAKKITSISGQSRQRFHHSSFFGGKAVAAAGIFITDEQGFLTRLYPHSGHYRPGEAHMQRVLFFLYHEGVDLRSFEMDTQQIMHVTRDCEPAPSETTKGTAPAKTEKKKKVEALHLLPAFYIACFLAHKARCIGEGLFAQIHQIRQTDVASVSEALAVIDQGGFWCRNRKT
jgi:hypothetical protein